MPLDNKDQGASGAAKGVTSTASPLRFYSTT